MPSKARDQGEATAAAARKIWVLLELLRSRSVRFTTYARLYGESHRTFQRDLQHLRNIGKTGGFTISPIRDKERAELLSVDSKLRSLDGSAHVIGLLGALGGAFGAPVSLELGDLATAGGDAGFSKFVLPQLRERSQVAEAYARLKSAWEVRPGPAIVRFSYRTNAKSAEERLIEPYRVLLRSGTAYIVGYDLGRKDWRLFALDRMVTQPQRAGTIQHVRSIPAQYESCDTIGFMKTHAPPVAVTVRLSARVAASATSRKWQDAQRVQNLSDGSAEITFDVGDIDEVVRWAMGYGDEAVVLSPPEAAIRAVNTCINSSSPTATSRL